MITFHVCYEVVTEESAIDGEAAERGYYGQGGWYYPVDDLEPAVWSLHEICRTYGRSFEDCGRWFVTVTPDQDYRTGDETTYSVHPPATITPASYARLRRLLCYR